MAGNLSYNIFALIPEAMNNDAARPGSLVLEYHQETITISSNEGSVEVSTALGEVYGLIDLSYVATAGSDPTDSAKLVTDGVVSSGDVTVSAKTEDIADGTITVRFLLVGTKAVTTI